MNKKVIIIVIVIVLLVLLSINQMVQNKAPAEGEVFTNIDKPQQSKFAAGGEQQAVTTTDNSSDELNAVLVALDEVNGKLGEQNLKVNGLVSQIKEKDQIIDSLEKQYKKNLRSMKSEMDVKINNIKEDITTNSDENINQELGVNNNPPKNVSDDYIPNLSRPLLAAIPERLSSVLDSGPAPINSASNKNSSSSNIVWYEADDVIVTTDSRGTEVKKYPFTSEEISGLNLDSVLDEVNQDSESDKETGNKRVGKTDTLHEIYTIPTDSSLWDAVSMGSMIGRVPKNGTLKNPYRFKAMLSNENMATNGIYIPNLKNMVVSGYLEGDMLMECVRGYVDSATYTFMDGRIATTNKGTEHGEQIAHISDQWGNECIPGTYISTIKKYIAYVGGANALSGVGSLLSNAGNVTTVDGTSVTTTLANGITGSSVLGAAVEGGASAASDFISDELGDAFSAVIIEAGEPLVIHVDSQLNIDYDTEGRLIVNSDNVEEFLN